jgi:hypothetical protein
MNFKEVKYAYVKCFQLLLVGVLWRFIESTTNMLWFHERKFLNQFSDHKLVKNDCALISFLIDV